MKGKYRLAIVLVLTLVGGVEVYLGWSGRYGASSERSSRTPSPSPMEYFPHLKPGDPAVAFEAQRLPGGTQQIESPAEGPPTYLFVLSLTCGTCAKTVPKWNRLARELDGRARVFGIVLGSYQREQELLEEKGLAFPVVRFPNRETMERYKANKVPQTIVVAPGGTVESNVMGELTDDDIDELLSRASARGGGLSS